MDELLKHLEKQIKDLISQHAELRQNNQQLHQGKFLIVREKDSLLLKQQKAITQIEALVSKLKALDGAQS
jgi:uncharacterized protein (TIGR02449 family)